jgi:hypothetical protein
MYENGRALFFSFFSNDTASGVGNAQPCLLEIPAVLLRTRRTICGLGVMAVLNYRRQAMGT